MLLLGESVPFTAVIPAADGTAALACMGTTTEILAFVNWSSTAKEVVCVVGDKADPVGMALVGLAEGLPGVTVGPSVVGALVLLNVTRSDEGPEVGDPGVTVGPQASTALVIWSATVVGFEVGFPGDTVGPTVKGAFVTGLLLGDPGITVGPMASPSTVTFALVALVGF